MNSMTYEAKSTTHKSRQRRRTEKDAVALLDGLIRLPPYERRSALKRIRTSRQPGVEARRIANHAKRRAVIIGHDEIDLADVQELRVKLLRRDGGIWEPQASLLHQMDASIASGEMDQEVFEESAAVVLGMAQALPKKFIRAA